ncbi:hypothetical protein VTG60DRAFT_3971 [Thermothelomyces hinnuleus]
MAGFSMNKVLGTIKKRPTLSRGGSVDETSVDPANDTPEAIAARCVKQFCQSVGSASVRREQLRPLPLPPLTTRSSVRHILKTIRAGS